MGATTHSFIIASRITQGHDDYAASTSAERQSIIANYLRIKDDPKMQNTGSHIDLLHHNDSDISLQSQKSPEHAHIHHTHSLRKHFSHHSHDAKDEINSEGEKTEVKEKEKLSHHNSIRAHFTHHKEDSKAQISHSTTELVDGHEGIPEVHEAEIRKVMTVEL